MITIARLFPLLVIIVSVLAWIEPAPLTGLFNATTPLLTITLFCLGLILRPADFYRLWQHPTALATGLILQFALMPLLAFGAANLLNVNSDLTLGMIITAACTAAIAATAFTYLASGDIALAFCLSVFSTLLSLVHAPWIILFTTGIAIDWNAAAILTNLAGQMLLPLLAGMLCHRLWPAMSKSLYPHMETIISLLLLMIIALAVAFSQTELAITGDVSVQGLTAILLFNLLALVLAYLLPRWNGHTDAEARAIALSVALQNTSGAIALSTQTAGLLAATPAVLYNLTQYISAGLLAGWWKWQINRRIRKLRS